MSYKIPKIWPDSTVYILGGGPSLLSTLFQWDHTQLDACKFIGVNASYRLGVWVDVAYFSDAKFYWWNKNGLDHFPGLKITLNDVSGGKYKSVEGREGINVIKKGKLQGLNKNPALINSNRSSGAAAINVALHLGAKRIILMGFDMRLVDGKKNWLQHSREHTKQNPFKNFLKSFQSIHADAKRLGIEILNATPKSALTVFPMVDLKEVM